MPDMRWPERLQPDIFHRLKKPDQSGTQGHWQGLNFGVDGRNGFNRPFHAGHIAYRLYIFNPCAVSESFPDNRKRTPQSS